MQITEEARRAAAIAVAVEVNGWPGAASLPYHPTDPTVADTMRRITDVALEAAVPLLAPQPMPTREQFAEATHDFDHAHSWRDERFCPQYACLEVYLPRADAVLALLNGGVK